MVGGVNLVRRLRRAVKSVVGHVDIQQQRPSLPSEAWFDSPDALEQIERRGTTGEDRAVLRSWVTDGYAIVEGLIDHGLLDEMVEDLDRVFVGESVVPGVRLHDLVMPDGHRANTDHDDLMQLADDERVAVRDRSNWRVHGFFDHSDAAHRIRTDRELERIASMILGVPSRANYSINFHNGSTQALHQDSAVFHLGVRNLICGVWIACEDIVEGSGPLVYYPGSHRRAMFGGFDNYPLTNLRTSDPQTTAMYQTHVDTASAEYPERQFLARKGDVFFWHGMLIHGGTPITQPGLTRRSYVIHFIPDGADVAADVTGPTNW